MFNVYGNKDKAFIYPDGFDEGLPGYVYRFAGILNMEVYCLVIILVGTVHTSGD